MFPNQTIDEEVKERVLKVITTVNPRSYELDLQEFWKSFTEHKDINQLLSELDEYFVDTDQYSEIEDEQDIRPMHEIIQRKDIQLICYQWF